MATEYQITLTPSGHTFRVASDETILDAALRQGIGLPYGCRNGACGSCKGSIVSGDFDYGSYQARTLTNDEKSQGKALFCVGKPCSDMTLNVKEIMNQPIRRPRLFLARLDDDRRFERDGRQPE